MLLPSIRRLALADVSEETLRGLVHHGESLLVERKRRPPDPPRFGAAAASFANLLGGFILLGVDDDKTVVGYEKPQIRLAASRTRARRTAAARGEPGSILAA